MSEIKPSTFHNNRKHYNWSLYDISDAFLEKYKEHYRGTLYDLGCGERVYEKYFLQFCDKYIGVDWGNTLHFLKADIVTDLNQNLPIKNEAADSIVSLSVLEHLYEPQIFVNECYRILKKDGVVILQVPFMWHVHEAPYDFFRYTKYGLKHMFEKAGFTHVEIEEQTGFWVNWFVKLNYQLVRVEYNSWFKKAFLSRIIYRITNWDQKLGLWMDRRWFNSEGETQGYFVLAKKGK